jgi:hypothetical protein
MPLRPVSGFFSPRRKSPLIFATSSSCSSRKSEIACNSGSKATPCRINSQSAKLA